MGRNAYTEYTHTADSPSASFAAVTPSDSTDLTDYARALYVGGAGNLYVDGIEGGSNVGFIGVAAGTILSIAVKRVRATNTTATNIVALY